VRHLFNHAPFWRCQSKSSLKYCVYAFVKSIITATTGNIPH